MTEIDLNVDAGESFGAWRMGDDAALFARGVERQPRLRVPRRRPGHDPRRAGGRDRGRRRDRRAPRAARPRRLRAPPDHPDPAGDLATTRSTRSARCTPSSAPPARRCTTSSRTARSTPRSRSPATSTPRRSCRRCASSTRSCRSSRSPARACSARRSGSASPSSPRASPTAPTRPTARSPSAARPGAIIHDADEAAARAVRMALQGTVEALDGTVVELQPGTLCIHGDNPGSVATAQRHPRRARTRRHHDPRVLTWRPSVNTCATRRSSTSRPTCACSRSRRRWRAPSPTACARSTPATARSTSSGTTRTLSNDARERVDRRARWRPRDEALRDPAEITVPVRYGGLDTDDVAEATGLDPGARSRSCTPRSSTGSARARPSASR